MTTVTANADTQRFFAVTRYRFVLVDAAGAIANRNDYGKALDFAFMRRATAEAHAQRSGRFVVERS